MKYEEIKQKREYPLKKDYTIVEYIVYYVKPENAKKLKKAIKTDINLKDLELKIYGSSTSFFAGNAIETYPKTKYIIDLENTAILAYSLNKEKQDYEL